MTTRATPCTGCSTPGDAGGGRRTADLRRAGPGRLDQGAAPPPWLLAPAPAARCWTRPALLSRPRRTCSEHPPAPESAHASTLALACAPRFSPDLTAAADADCRPGPGACRPPHARCQCACCSKHHPLLLAGARASAVHPRAPLLGSPMTCTAGSGCQPFTTVAAAIVWRAAQAGVMGPACEHRVTLNRCMLTGQRVRDATARGESPRRAVRRGRGSVLQLRGRGVGWGGWLHAELGAGAAHRTACAGALGCPPPAQGGATCWPPHSEGARELRAARQRAPHVQAGGDIKGAVQPLPHKRGAAEAKGGRPREQERGRRGKRGGGAARVWGLGRARYGGGEASARSTVVRPTLPPVRRWVAAACCLGRPRPPSTTGPGRPPAPASPKGPQQPTGPPSNPLPDSPSHQPPLAGPRCSHLATTGSGLAPRSVGANSHALAPHNSGRPRKPA